MLLMTPRRALWEAVATVCIPTLAIWGVLLYLVRTNARSDEWPLYVIFVALPLPLIFPIYRRYLRGPVVGRERSPRVRFVAAAASAVLGATYIVSTLHRHRDTSDLVIHLVMGIAWLVIAGDNLRRALRSRDDSRGAALTT
jgi:hypothetical protein